MTKKLSQAFFGDKKFTNKLYEQLNRQGQCGTEDIRLIFQPYTNKISAIYSSDRSLTLFDIFEQFMRGLIEQFKEWQFHKFTTIVEIAAHVFEYSFEHWLSQQQSYRYFSDVLVRHALFRPPHSVCILNYDELQLISQYWLNHFHRYYPEYQQCMASSLNEVLRCHVLPGQVTTEKEVKQGRISQKSQVLKLLK